MDQNISGRNSTTLDLEKKNWFVSVTTRMRHDQNKQIASVIPISHSVFFLSVSFSTDNKITS